MQHTAFSDTMLLEEIVGKPAWASASSTPARPYASDYADSGSIAAGLTFQARDGLAYTLRRVTPADVAPLNVFLYRLSDQSRRMRFMTWRPCSPEFVREQVARMVAGAAGSSATLIATDPRGGPGAVAGVAELAYDRASGTGEIGLVVLDEAQRKGIGSELLRQLLQISRGLGLAELHGHMLAENRAIQQLIRGLRLPFTTTTQAGEMRIAVRVPE